MRTLRLMSQSAVCECPQKSSGSAQGQLSLTSLQEEFNEAGRRHAASSGPVTVAAVSVASCSCFCVSFSCFCASVVSIDVSVCTCLVFRFYFK